MAVKYIKWRYGWASSGPRDSGWEFESSAAMCLTAIVPAVAGLRISSRTAAQAPRRGRPQPGAEAPRGGLEEAL